MPTQPAEILRYTKLIRYCFQRLKTLGDELHADLGMNASLRAILEWLAEHGNQTVPQIAAAKSVSRQHVQKIVDELINKGLVDLAANPAHRRSPYVVLTAPGSTMFKDMQRREKRIIARLAAVTDDGQLRRAELSFSISPMHLLNSCPRTLDMTLTSRAAGGLDDLRLHFHVLADRMGVGAHDVGLLGQRRGLGFLEARQLDLKFHGDAKSFFVGAGAERHVGGDARNRARWRPASFP